MTTTDRLRVRFNDKDYSPAKIVRINYANKDYFSITWNDGGDVDIKSEFNGRCTINPLTFVLLLLWM
jgi:hypothetical protein